MTLYQVLLYVHIVCAVIWVGGAFYLQVLAVLTTRSTDPTDLPKLARQAQFIGTFVFIPAALLLFVAGAAMVLQAWNFGQLWIAVSVALWVLSAVAGAAYLGPRSRRVAQLFEAEGPESVAAREQLRKLFLVSRLELVSFAVIIALMVFKPGV
ncbi:MAG: DUF2269 family protein [Candidatus Limnocylindrales bacterium]